MLELPESAVIAGQLLEVLRGKRIEQVVAGFTPHGFAFFFGDPADYPALLEGRRIEDVASAAGQVELYIDDRRILFSDGVNVRYLEPGKAPPKKHQLYIRLEDDSAIVCTVQMYGGMQAFQAGAMDDNIYYKVAREKPSPLTEEFDERYFDGLVQGAKPTLSAKAFLATEQRIPGLGNGVLQDILYRAGIHPKTKLSAISDGQREKMFRSVKDTLGQMAQAGGRDTEKDIFGTPGGYRCILSKNTLAYPCPQCGGGISKQAYLGGAVYFCPACQPV